MKNRNKRRAETRRQQREAQFKGQFHPRSLARAVAHSRMKFAEFEQINKVKPGTNQSTFATKWREVASSMAK